MKLNTSNVHEVSQVIAKLMSELHVARKPVEFKYNVNCLEVSKDRWSLAYLYSKMGEDEATTEQVFGSFKRLAGLVKNKPSEATLANIRSHQTLRPALEAFQAAHPDMVTCVKHALEVMWDHEDAFNEVLGWENDLNIKKNFEVHSAFSGPALHAPEGEPHQIANHLNIEDEGMADVATAIYTCLHECIHTCGAPGARHYHETHFTKAKKPVVVERWVFNIDEGITDFFARMGHTPKMTPPMWGTGIPVYQYPMVVIAQMAKDIHDLGGAKMIAAAYFDGKWGELEKAIDTWYGKQTNNEKERRYNAEFWAEFTQLATKPREYTMAGHTEAVKKLRDVYKIEEMKDAAEMKAVKTQERINHMISEMIK
jgi:hypothetical protein